jgi:hypothetical protein
MLLATALAREYLRGSIGQPQGQARAGTKHCQWQQRRWTTEAVSKIESSIVGAINATGHGSSNGASQEEHRIATVSGEGGWEKCLQQRCYACRSGAEHVTGPSNLPQNSENLGQKYGRSQGLLTRSRFETRFRSRSGFGHRFKVRS